MITKANLWTQDLATVNDHFNPYFDMQIITFNESKFIHNKFTNNYK